MPYKKYLFIFSMFVFFIFFLTMIYNLLSPNSRIFSGLYTGISSDKASITDTKVLVNTISQLINDKDRLTIVINEKGICYWIRSTLKQKNLIEIKKYKSSAEKCFGVFFDESYIPLEHGINILGDTDCLCEGQEYILEIVNQGERNDLKISRV